MTTALRDFTRPLSLEGTIVDIETNGCCAFLIQTEREVERVDSPAKMGQQTIIQGHAGGYGLMERAKIALNQNETVIIKGYRAGDDAYMSMVEFSDGNRYRLLIRG